MNQQIEPWQNPLHRSFDPADRRWQALSIDERMAFMHAAQDEAIERNGYTSVGVFPTQDSGGYHFAYTIGLTTSFILTGMSQRAESLLDIAVRYQVTLDGVPFQVGDHKHAWCVFAPVSDEVFREHCTVAVGKGAFRARQIIWKDGDGWWPWEEGHARQELMGLVEDLGAEPGGDSMPIFAGDDWRPQP